VKAILILAEPEGLPFLANFVDRPFLRHTAEFLVDQGIRKIVVVGPAAAQTEKILGSGRLWDASIEYREARAGSEYQAALISGSERFLLASATRLPKFPLRRLLEGSAGAVVYGKHGDQWTGWALVQPQHAALMPQLCDQAAVLSCLQSLPDYEKLSAEQEFRCSNDEDLWKAHIDAQESNLASIFHGGLEVKPGVWMGRNASVAADAEIVPPAYIGENSRIGPGAQIGPFAVIAKDCLIAPRTIVRHAVVAPGTYAGNNLELDHVLVNKRQLFDVRFGVSLDRVDSPILDGVFDFHWSAIPRRVYASLASAVTLYSTRVPLTLFSMWSRLRRQLVETKN
jgi:hypothetical protein